MKTAPPLRFGLVGSGAIAQTYVEALQSTPIAQVVGVCDVVRQRADALAETLKCDSYDCYQTMAAKTGCDAAIICTPPAAHPEICIWLVQRGIHVLCEKPLAIDSETALAMLEAANDAGVNCTMASKFRYVNDVTLAKSIVTSGMLGDILLFENCFTARVSMATRWNSVPRVSGGGVLIDNGTHSVDIMRYFLGPIADLQVVEGKRHQNLDVEDTVRMFVRTASGVMGSIDLSWSMNKEQPNYISIFGSEGALLVGWKGSRYRLRDQEWITFGSGYSKIEAFRSQIDNFVRAVRGEEQSRISSEDALASVQVIEAAYAALRGNEWSRVPYSLYDGDDSIHYQRPRNSMRA